MPVRRRCRAPRPRSRATTPPRRCAAPNHRPRPGRAVPRPGPPARRRVAVSAVVAAPRAGRFVQVHLDPADVHRDVQVRRARRRPALLPNKIVHVRHPSTQPRRCRPSSGPPGRGSRGRPARPRARPSCPEDRGGHPSCRGGVGRTAHPAPPAPPRRSATPLRRSRLLGLALDLLDQAQGDPADVTGVDARAARGGGGGGGSATCSGPTATRTSRPSRRTSTVRSPSSAVISAARSASAFIRVRRAAGSSAAPSRAAVR